ncbi:hypothetical protein BV20DRAFT_187783 [Pilatotrama ljubarskyi]|nr:hypothetical protein BV20DRAFT_187783 [Pilatotrama ljubarskyi]
MVVDNLIISGSISLELAVDQGFERMNENMGRPVRKDSAGIMDGLSYEATSNHIPGLRYARQARFDYHRNDRSPCETNTRAEVLATVYTWLKPDDSRLTQLAHPLQPVRRKNPIFWINGLAGTGKSTLAQTIAMWCEEGNFLGASFFCARDGDRSNVQLIFCTIAHQLGLLHRGFHAALSAAVKADPDIHASLVSRQLQKLLVEPLRMVKSQGSFPEYAVILDALDECKDEEAVSVVLKALSLHVAELGPLRFVITSRPVPNVTMGFRIQELVDNTQQLSLSAVPADLTRRDISRFVRRRLAFIKEQHYIVGEWPTDDEVEKLVWLAGELFIFAATAVKYVGDSNTGDPESQLRLLLRSAESPGTPLPHASPYSHLDALYLQVLRSAFPATARSDAIARVVLMVLLGCIALLQEQLSPGALESLLHLPAGTVRRVLRLVHSIVAVPATDETPIRVVHLSFSDFIVDSRRCIDPEFLVNPTSEHTFLARHCLQILLELLCHNICRVEHEFLKNNDILDLHDRITKFIPPHLLYASKHWGFHFCHAEQIDQGLLDLLNKFCQEHLLHWLELLSLCGHLEIAAGTLQSTRAALENSPLSTTGVATLLAECERLLYAFYSAIHASCFQVYNSALLFCPEDSPLHISHYPDTSRLSITLYGGFEKKWSPNIMTLEAHTEAVNSLAYSPSGEHIVSGSEDCTIKLWDARLGALLNSFEGHTQRVRSVVFSPSGKAILSGSQDGTVKLWDSTTGACLDSWNWLESAPVDSVACSADATVAAAAFLGRSTIVLWSTSDVLGSRDTPWILDHDPSEILPLARWSCVEM